MATYKLTQQSGVFSGGPHSDYPAYVDLTEIDAAMSQADADSIRVYTDAALTNEIPREIVSTEEMHCKIGSFSSGDEIYVVIDGTSSDYAITDTFGAEAVWTGYEFVFHEGGGTDSSGNITSTANGGVTAGDTTGKIGSATNFDGSSQYFALSGKGALSNSGFSVQAWTNLDTETEGDVLGLYDGSGTGGDIFLFKTEAPVSGGGYQFRSGHLSSSEFNPRNIGSYSTATWIMLHGTYDGSNGAFYIDGSSATTFTQASADPFDDSTVLRIGARTDNVQYWDGLLSEIRATVNELSANWITTEYNNQNSPSTFWSIAEVVDRRIFNIS